MDLLSIPSRLSLLSYLQDTASPAIARSPEGGAETGSGRRFLAGGKRARQAKRLTLCAAGEDKRRVEGDQDDEAGGEGMTECSD